MKSSDRRDLLIGVVLLLSATLFTAYYAFPEIRLGRVPLNDFVFHITATERLARGIGNHEPLLDSWVSEWSLGYPVWLSYQPLPHLATAVVVKACHAFAAPEESFARLFYLLLVGLPASVYIGALLMGLNPIAAGLASLFVFASSATGDLGSYGIGYGSLVWRGSGLYTQLWALHFLVICWGVTARALDSGKRSWLMASSILIGLTALSHIIFGYVAFASAVLIAVKGPRPPWATRLIRLITIVVPAFLLSSWFIVPLLLRLQVVNHSRWEDPQKWDSYGAPFIVREILAGRFFDFGRAPILSVLLGVGVCSAAVCYHDHRARKLLFLCGAWLTLFFGRETWGRLVWLVGVPGDLQMHRLQAAFELSAILLAAFGLAHLASWTRTKGPLFGRACAAAIAVAIIWIGTDRATYLKQDQAWGDETLAAFQATRSDLDAAFADVRQILAERPGRVSAGLASSWGKQFAIGQVPVYAFLSRNHIDQASFLYHSMSKTSEVMVLRDESSMVHDVAFGIRAVIAPATLSMPGHLRRRSVHGPFAVYESSPEGYFGIVDVAGTYDGPSSTHFEPASAWLNSPLQRKGMVVSLDPRNAPLPTIHRWNPLPDPPPSTPMLDGRVLRERKLAETYIAEIEVNRPAYAFVKITWNPDLEATVDGQPTPIFHVTPGFGAVPLSGGRHEVAVRYTPGALRSTLFFLGLGCCAGLWFLLREPFTKRLETAAANRFGSVNASVSSPRRKVLALLILFALVALHPLFRGKLIGGHDAASYPARVVEMAKLLGDSHFPPLWAPDLSAGHGQPLFEFNPPLVYWVALPFRAIHLGITDSLQFGLFLLFLLGAAAIYRTARLLQAPRYAALGGAVAWLFAPYVSLDLFVRSAFAESAAVAVAPVALWALLSAIKHPNGERITGASAAIALILLAHSAVALLLVPGLVVIAIVYSNSVSKSNGTGRFSSKLAPLLGGLTAIAGALGLSAFFWIPSLADIPNLHASRLLENGFEWQSHILAPIQLLWGHWGYGVSVPGPNDGISFNPGPAHLIFGIAGLLTVASSGKDSRRNVAIVFGGLVVVGAFLSVEWSAPLWGHARLLQHLIYPWRSLFLPALFLPLLAVFEFERLGPRLTILLTGLLVAINLTHTEPKEYVTYDDEYYAPESIALNGLNTSTHEEFEPRWSHQRPAYSAVPLTGITEPIQVIQNAQHTTVQEFIVQAARETRVESSVFYYPGWTVYVDGAVTPTSPVPVRGTIQFDIPRGEHSVKVELQLTLVRRISLAVSIVTSTILAGAVVLRRRYRRNAFP